VARMVGEMLLTFSIMVQGVEGLQLESIRCHDLSSRGYWMHSRSELSVTIAISLHTTYTVESGGKIKVYPRSTLTIGRYVRDGLYFMSLDQ
jgi:hypothetical protein